MTKDDFVEQQDLTTAEEFIDYLRPTSPRWKPSSGPDCLWVFRGHGDSSWELRPSAWREKGKIVEMREKVRPGIVQMLVDTPSAEVSVSNHYTCDLNRIIEHIVQLVTETYAIQHFCYIADEIGLPVHDAEEVTLISPAVRDYAKNSFPPGSSAPYRNSACPTSRPTNPIA